METILTEYVAILNHYQWSGSVRRACRAYGIAYTTFFRQRYLAEMKIVDAEVFNEVLQKTISNDFTMKHLGGMCRKMLQEPPYRDKAAAMRASNKLLPLGVLVSKGYLNNL